VTTNYLTDNVKGKVNSYVSYNVWGTLTSNTVLKLGSRQLADLMTNYASYPYDSVLGVYSSLSPVLCAGEGKERKR